MVKQFHQSVAKIKREESRKYAKDNAGWPSDEMSNNFDEVMGKIGNKRNDDYVSAINKRYPKSLLEKVMNWAGRLPPLERDRMTIEQGIVRFVKENPSEVTEEELSVVFDSKGKLKEMIKAPDEDGLGELQQLGDGSWQEVPKTKIHITPRNLTEAQARNMTSAELDKIFKEHGIDPTQQIE